MLGWKHRAGVEILADGLVMWLAEDGLTVRDADGERHVPADPDGARVAVDRAFVDAVCGLGDDVRVPYAEALRTHRLALAVAESARTGRPVALPTGPAAGSPRRSRTRGERRCVTGWWWSVDPAGWSWPNWTRRSCARARSGWRRSTAASRPAPNWASSKGTNPYLRHLGRRARAVPAREASTPYPVTRLGYMQVGRVVASRTPAVAVGEVGAMTCGHRSGWVADPLTERFVPLPDDLDPLLGVYVAHMGPICANGLLHAAADLCGTDVRTLGDGVRGRRVAVVGGGVVALLTALFARRPGAASVVVVDPTPARRQVAEALGLDTLDPDADDPAVVLKTRWNHAAGDRGADVVFQCRGRTGRCSSRCACCAPRAR
ncbi:hypothetical protein V2I01_40080 [Micromonospora sp. BRA006-A]|nr:hypothetical protein [Micromonospora sp. BRA006-A]